MRVIAGEVRRYNLKSPRGDKIRPTSDIIKETLFNIIGNDIYDVCFADLFAGTGQIGIEALSRGAKFCVFIDQDKTAINLIKENVEHVGYNDYSEIIQSALPNAIKLLDRYSPKVIFMDPPYQSGVYKDCLEQISKLKCIDDESMIIAEADKNTDFSYLESLGLKIEREKIYKSSKHIFINKL